MKKILAIFAVAILALSCADSPMAPYRLPPTYPSPALPTPPVCIITMVPDTSYVKICGSWGCATYLVEWEREVNSCDRKAVGTG